MVLLEIHAQRVWAGRNKSSPLLFPPVDDARRLDAGFEFLSERAEGEGDDFRR
jgi:hypothetical protein